MLARVITLRFDPLIGGFDDEPLRDFLKDKDVLAIREHFFVRHEVPYLAVMVTYDPPRLETPASAAESTHHQDTSWRAHVTEDELPLFNVLRDWRSERSKREGVPPYVICTNRQFAAMVKSRPQSLSKLAEIDGFGKAKLEKYGQEILGILATTPVDQKGDGATPAHEEATDGSAQG